MEKVLLISAFYLENTTSRPYQIRNYFAKRSVGTKVITTNFDHSKKKKRSFEDGNVITINVPQYFGTFSLKRIFSHVFFAISISKHIKKCTYNYMYIAIPPNFSSWIATRLALKHKKVLIVDIIDVWPQPSNNYIIRIVNYFWHMLRKKAVKYSDVLLLESTAYTDIVKKYTNDFNILYLSKKQEKPCDKFKKIEILENDLINILYLGNFSGSYDFDSLIGIMKNIRQKKVCLHIIGGGPEKQNFINKLRQNDLYYYDYGIVFDEEKKSDIFKVIHFGYNAVKEKSLVGLSYKSIEYLSYGIPLINSVRYDTLQMVDSYKSGINFTANQTNYVAKKLELLSSKEYIDMIEGAERMFFNNFRIEVFENTLDRILRNKGVDI